ncbi:MAG: hypothetical protein JWN27_4396 [Candidatus Eremiobacteraeota bacterium]|nr:hypothetical protein [Candidatus Eremiobacteraeota bacterium]
MIALAPLQAVPFSAAPAPAQPIDVLRIHAAPARDAPAKHAVISVEESHPTLVRPGLEATGLFQGWGPRLG